MRLTKILKELHGFCQCLFHLFCILPIAGGKLTLVLQLVKECGSGSRSRSSSTMIRRSSCYATTSCCMNVAVAGVVVQAIGRAHRHHGPALV
jgi:hypothetical protein